MPWGWSWGAVPWIALYVAGAAIALRGVARLRRRSARRDWRLASADPEPAALRRDPYRGARDVVGRLQSAAADLGGGDAIARTDTRLQNGDVQTEVATGLYLSTDVGPIALPSDLVVSAGDRATWPIAKPGEWGQWRRHEISRGALVVWRERGRRVASIRPTLPHPASAWSLARTIAIFTFTFLLADLWLSTAAVEAVVQRAADGRLRGPTAAVLLRAATLSPLHRHDATQALRQSLRDTTQPTHVATLAELAAQRDGCSAGARPWLDRLQFERGLAWAQRCPHGPRRALVVVESLVGQGRFAAASRAIREHGDEAYIRALAQHDDPTEAAMSTLRIHVLGRDWQATALAARVAQRMTDHATFHCAEIAARWLLSGGLDGSELQSAAPTGPRSCRRIAAWAHGRPTGDLEQDRFARLLSLEDSRPAPAPERAPRFELADALLDSRPSVRPALSEAMVAALALQPALTASQRQWLVLAAADIAVAHAWAGRYGAATATLDTMLVRARERDDMRDDIEQVARMRTALQRLITWRQDPGATVDPLPPRPVSPWPELRELERAIDELARMRLDPRQACVPDNRLARRQGACVEAWSRSVAQWRYTPAYPTLVEPQGWPTDAAVGDPAEWIDGLAWGRREPPRGGDPLRYLSILDATARGLQGLGQHAAADRHRAAVRRTVEALSNPEAARMLAAIVL